MVPEFDPHTDPILISLKQIAIRGGDRGPLYDQGVLFVIDQIERKGQFIPDSIGGIISLMSLQEKHQSHILTDKELDEGRQFLVNRGWNLAQGSEFANGIRGAESLLSHFEGERKP